MRNRLGVRIGLAFNLKPQAPAPSPGVVLESPSHPCTPERALRSDLDQPDLYAEWDEPGTIDAVERALRPLGRGHSHRGRPVLPRPPGRRPARLRLQHRRGSLRPEPRGPRPGDLRVPRHSLPPPPIRSPSALALHKGRAKEVMAGARGADRAVRHGPESTADAAACTLPFPVFRQAGVRGLGQGHHRPTASATTARSCWPRSTTC